MPLFFWLYSNKKEKNNWQGEWKWYILNTIIKKSNEGGKNMNIVAESLEAVHTHTHTHYVY